ncbi:MAG: hypothetical protein H6Q09_916 [Acidobacteria bacterium]|nr:hypothetical protein [Acidobacteriota bacterium]
MRWLSLLPPARVESERPDALALPAVPGRARLAGVGPRHDSAAFRRSSSAGAVAGRPARRARRLPRAFEGLGRHGNPGRHRRRRGPRRPAVRHPHRSRRRVQPPAFAAVRRRRAVHRSGRDQRGRRALCRPRDVAGPVPAGRRSARRRRGRGETGGLRHRGAPGFGQARTPLGRVGRAFRRLGVVQRRLAVARREGMAAAADDPAVPAASVRGGRTRTRAWGWEGRPTRTRSCST